MTNFALSPSFGKLAYGILYVLVLPASLWFWAIVAARNVHLPPVLSVAGGEVVAAAGLLLMAVATWSLARHGRGLPMSPYPPTVFVASGPYSVFGHPIYAGFALACAGVSIAAGSASGLWLVTPTVVLACTAFVLGHERLALGERFPSAVSPPWLHLPSEGAAAPTLADRVSTLVLVLLPWLLLYEAVLALGLPPDAVSAYARFELGWPVQEWTEILYASTYVVVVLAPFMATRRGDLRRFAVRGWAATGIVTLLYLAVPLVAPPRAFTPHGTMGQLLLLERSLDSAAGAFPSFHVIWAVFAASLLAASRPRLRPVFWGWALAVAGSCLTTGMHALADVVAGLVLSFVLLRVEALWEGLRSLAERVAGSWREWDFGSVRLINHGAWAGAGTFVGIFIVGVLIGPGNAGAILVVATVSLVSAALWAQVIEGSPRLLRPYGFYGGVLGVVLGSLAAPAFGVGVWEILAAFAVAGPWIQAGGRIRCLVQGCCHGSPAPEGVGIRYSHPRSRVTRLANLAGVPIHPTPLYSILWNAVIALCMARLWLLRSPTPLIVGLYLVLTGVGRFVEEAYRGEPQTPVIAGLRLYQWIAIATVVVGAATTAVVGPLAPIPTPHWTALWPAATFGVLTAAALGVDFPRSDRRFARLA
ncbi:MAG: prolipoprotein diacylglyceryl transferase [Acidobacteriia bacterium]|nr:prolipoprotein diacylglyceryl transferase [Terriglobia bacterium]